LTSVKKALLRQYEKATGTLTDTRAISILPSSLPY
jgi:hypothetical protein